MRSSLDDVIEGLGISQFTTPASLRAWSLSCRWYTESDRLHCVSMAACLGHTVDRLGSLFE